MATQDQITANLIALGFTNSSATAIYNKFAEAAGLTVDNTLTEIANSENIITQLLIAKDGYLKSDYYTAAALAFQYGDDLTVNMDINPVTGKPYLTNIYAVIDPTKQIINQAAFEEIVNEGALSQLFLKVATKDPISGLLVGLSPLQLTAFSNYFLTFEAPGLPVSIISTDGNVFNFFAVATYFAAYDLPTLQTDIANALTAFQDSFQFDGELFIGQLQDYVKNAVPGLKDFYIYNTTVDGAPFGGFVSLNSGYFNYQTGITDNITYKAVAS